MLEWGIILLLFVGGGVLANRGTGNAATAGVAFVLLAIILGLYRFAEASL